MKRIIRALPLLIALCCAPLLFAETTIEQASLQLAADAAIGRANGIFLESADEQLLIAYQAAESIQLGRLSDDGWSVTALPIAGSPILQGFAANGQLLLFAYIEERALWTLSSLDGGRTFLSPVQIAAENHSPSVQGMAIDEQGTIHLLFHRHDRYWDHNYASSTNQGRSYTVRNAFTRATDSSSTGYSGSLSAVHGRLYTIYQDTNNRNMIKLGISENGGQSWRIENLARTSGGVLAFAVDPRSADRLFVGSIDTEALRILKVETASTTTNITPLYEDRTVTHSAAAQASVHVALSDEGELIVIYLNAARSAYEVLVSQDGGESWIQESVEGAIDAQPWRQGASLKVWDDMPSFIRGDGEGQLLLHGFATDGYEEEPFDPDTDLLSALGIATITDPHRPFTVTYDEEMKIVMLVAAEDGAHELYHAFQATMPLTMIVSSTAEGDEEVIWNLDDDFNFIDRVPLSLVKGTTYMLITSVMQEGDLGKSATLILRPTADTPSLTATPPAQGEAVVLKIEAPVGARVKAGPYSSFIISERGDLYASGLSDQGQLGQGSLAAIKEFPMLIRYSKDAAAGSAHSLFLGEDGRLMVSGRNAEHQLGDGTTTRRASPFVLASAVIDMAGGHAHTLFVKKDRSLWAAGSNRSGQLGIGSTAAAPTPVKVMEDIARVWARGECSFALTADGRLYGWGENSSGQLGTGDTQRRTNPTHIASNVASVAPGGAFTLVLQGDGSLWATGTNSDGQFGTKEPDSSLRLIKVVDAVVSIAAGEQTSYYIDTQARLWAAGSNQYGQWGNGTTDNTSDADGFALVLCDVKEVAAGARHAIALKRDGTVWTTGSNAHHQLGDRSEGIRRGWKQVFQVVD